MNLFKTYPFHFNGRDYQIKVFYNDKLINVVAFRDNYPDNGIRHQIQVPKQADIQKILNSPVIEEFIEMSRTDIAAQRWQKLLS